MNITRAMALASLMAVATSPAFAFNLNDAVNAAATLQNGKQGNNAAVAAAPEAAGLLNTLGSTLNITPTQAIGGTGAMLGLAKNQLSTADYAQLSKSVPGIDKLSGNNALGGLSGLSGLLGKSDQKNISALNNALGDVKTTSDMNSAFSALGMNSGMVGQFAPVILQYLGQQGVGGPLLKSLGSVWGTGTGS
ncbi:DUF2780 domain-containing protein [Pseudomonas coleopterorum]|uniref:DUF2780 domain-containing protein n=1 Tax=Pseudomonas TaxID=286 RepID=UPI00249BA588|nr:MULTISPECIES: DUF2780 domain-containing protein [Pseudomonas]MDY1017563.1 DUF2780 domain-containing protein [Pseudomonas coleopterorum]